MVFLDTCFYRDRLIWLSFASPFTRSYMCCLGMPCCWCDVTSLTKALFFYCFLWIVLWIVLFHINLVHISTIVFNRISIWSNIWKSSWQLDMPYGIWSWYLFMNMGKIHGWNRNDKNLSKHCGRRISFY